jgi:hypothetical protein
MIITDDAILQGKETPIGCISPQSMYSLNIVYITNFLVDLISYFGKTSV